jgi:hypothetical protein
MIGQHTLKVAGQPGCYNVIGCYRSLGFTREGNAQASALQDHHLWLMVHVCQQEVDSCRSCASCPVAAARPVTLLLNDGLGERQPLTPYCRRLHLLCSVYYCRMCSVQSSGLADSAQNVRVKPDVTCDSARQLPTRHSPAPTASSFDQ